MEQITAVYDPLPRWEDRLRREPRLDIDEWTLLAEARIVPPEAPPPCLPIPPAAQTNVNNPVHLLPFTH